MSETFSLIQRHKGRGIKTWYIRTCTNGKDTYKSTKTTVKAEAMRIFAEYTKNSSTGARTANIDDVNVIDELDRWVAIQDTRFAKGSYTLREYRRNASELNDFLTRRRIHTLPRIDLATAQDYVNGLMQRNMKASSIGTAIRIIKAFFNWVIDSYELTARNPFAKVIKPTEEKHMAEFWTAEECDSIIAHSESKFWAAFFGLQCYAGLRFFEARKVQVEDIRDGALRILQDKTKKDSFIPISAKLQALLDGVIDGRTSGSLFVGRIGLNHATASKHLKHAVTAAGLNDRGRVFIHRLRHSFASNLLRGGVNVKSVQVLGRWASPNVLLKHYAGVIPSELTDAVNKL